jgi:hypothetical protein
MPDGCLTDRREVAKRSGADIIGEATERREGCGRGETRDDASTKFISLRRVGRLLGKDE